MGVGRAAVNSWEHGRVVPGRENLAKLATVLATSVDYLELKTDDPTPLPGNLSQSRVLRLSARYGIDPEAMSNLLLEVAEPFPEEVYDLQYHLHKAREALVLAEDKMAALFGNPLFDKVDQPEEADGFSLEEIQNVYSQAVRSQLAKLGFKMGDFREPYSEETIGELVKMANKDRKLAVNLLKNLAISNEYAPGVSKGKAARKGPKKTEAD